MICQGSCDTEDWSNVYWKLSFAITGINDVNTSVFLFLLYFDSINAALVGIKDFLKKKKNIINCYKLLTSNAYDLVSSRKCKIRK